MPVEAPSWFDFCKLSNMGPHMPECDGPQHRSEQRSAECTVASDAGANRALANSKDGSFGKRCEGFDQH